METNEDERLVKCQHLCQEISGCEYFSFHSPTAMCSLKSEKSREHPQQSYISGKKYCGIYILLETGFETDNTINRIKRLIVSQYFNFLCLHRYHLSKQRRMLYRRSSMWIAGGDLSSRCSL